MAKKTATKAVIYARYSPRRKNKKDDKKCVSCETQIEYCEGYCTFRKLDVVGVRRDDGLSGKDTNRPGLQGALELAVKHKAVLVFYSLSRLARSVRDAIEIADRLRDAGAHLCSVTESINSAGAFGKMVFVILAAMGEWEREVISERTSAAMRRHQATGRRMSAIPPFGWRADAQDGSRMVPDEHELEAIACMQTWRTQGFSYTKIALKLDMGNYPPREVTKKFKDRTITCKGKWYAASIRRILNRVEAEVA